MARKYKLLISLSIALVTASAVMAYKRANPPVPLLLLKATKVADLDNVFGLCLWLSDHELIVAVSDPKSPPIGWSGHIELYDTTTHSHRTLTGLTSAIMAHSLQYNFTGPQDWERSPDSNWLKWIGAGSNGKLNYITAGLDGRAYHNWHYVDSTGSSTSTSDLWVGGSRWVSTVTTGTSRFVILRDAAHPTNATPYLESTKEGKSIMGLISKSNHNLPTGERLLTMPAGDMSNDHLYEMRVVPAGSQPGAPGTIVDTIEFPSGSTVWSVGQNKQMNSTLFTVTKDDVSPLSKLLHHMHLLKSLPVKVVENVCEYNLRSRELRIVGSIPVTNPANPDREISEVEWLQDGKRFQFRYNNALYIVPVDAKNATD